MLLCKFANCLGPRMVYFACLFARLFFLFVVAVACSTNSCGVRGQINRNKAGGGTCLKNTPTTIVDVAACVCVFCNFKSILVRCETLFHPQLASHLAEIAAEESSRRKYL